MATGRTSLPSVRAAAAAIGLAFILLFVLNTFIGSPVSQNRAAEYFSSEEIQRGLRYSQERELLFWCATGLQLALLTALVCTPWARRLTDLFDRWTGHRWLLTLFLVSTSYFLLNEVLSLPVGLASLEQARAWHMTDRGIEPWLIDRVKNLGVSAVEWSIVVFGLYGLMYFVPRHWWLWAALGGTVLGAVYALVMPELIQPLFNKFTPLDDPYLRQRIEALAKKAGVTANDVEVMDASTQGRHTNAYFVGLGPTRRVVLYDTLLRSHNGISPESAASFVGQLQGGPLLAGSQMVAAQAEGYDELETVLGHEIGHWQHDHISKGLAMASLAGLVGLYLLSRILHWAVGRKPFSLTTIADPAGLPLIVLMGILGSWLAMPVENSISRAFERQADGSALELAGKPDAFIDAEKRMARQNLSNVAPTAFNSWMFGSHPPTVERIEMAEQWKN
jgi:STE24 endopeptidase